MIYRGIPFWRYLTLFADMTALTLLRRSLTAVSCSAYEAYAPVRSANWRFLPPLQRRQLHWPTCGRPAALLASKTTATQAAAAAQAPNAHANASGKFKTRFMQIARAIADL